MTTGTNYLKIFIEHKYFTSAVIKMMRISNEKVDKITSLKK